MHIPIRDKIDGQEDSIDLHVDSEYEGMVEMSDKEGKKSKYQAEKNSDSSSEEKISKKKRKKEKKEKKHKKDKNPRPHTKKKSEHKNPWEKEGKTEYLISF